MKDFLINRILLFPYWAILSFRHFLYNNGWKSSRTFPAEIISVGNITVGGTGKTPYVEMLIRNYADSEKIAVISRGYGRKSRGYREVLPQDRVADSGDEPLQIKRKFPQIRVIVDENRVRAIESLLRLTEEQGRPTLIILDDAFQHRHVTPSRNILLIDYNRPIDNDTLLPVGRLRDLPERISTATEVVITKCPHEPGPEEREEWRKRFNLNPSVRLSFTILCYEKIQPVFPETEQRYAYSNFAILVSGIANPVYFQKTVAAKYKIVKTCVFSDHRNFSHSDINYIESTAAKNPEAVIITTEKDVQRFWDTEMFSPETKKRFFYLPVVMTELKENDPDYNNYLI